MRRIRKWLVALLAVIVIVPTVAYQLGTAMNANEIENIEIGADQEGTSPEEKSSETEDLLISEGEDEEESGLVAPGETMEEMGILSLSDLTENDDMDVKPIISINPDDPDYVSVIVDYPIDVVYNGLDQTWEPDVFEVGEFHAWENEGGKNPGDTCRRLIKDTEYIVQYLDENGLPKSDRTNPTGPIIVKVIGQGAYHGEVTRSYQIIPADDSNLGEEEQISNGEGTNQTTGGKKEETKKRSGFLGTIIEKVEEIFRNDDKVALNNTELSDDDSDDNYSVVSTQLKGILVVIAGAICGALALMFIRMRNRR